MTSWRAFTFEPGNLGFLTAPVCNRIPRIDPYLVWADVTDYREYERTGDWVTVIAQLAAEATFDQLLAETPAHTPPEEPWIHIPQAYRNGLCGNNEPTARVFTARLSRQNLPRLLASGFVERVELGMAVQLPGTSGSAASQATAAATAAATAPAVAVTRP